MLPSLRILDDLSGPLFIIKKERVVAVQKLLPEGTPEQASHVASLEHKLHSVTVGAYDGPHRFRSIWDLLERDQVARRQAESLSTHHGTMLAAAEDEEEGQNWNSSHALHLPWLNPPNAASPSQPFLTASTNAAAMPPPPPPPPPPPAPLDNSKDPGTLQLISLK